MNIADPSALRECTSCQLCAAVCPHKAIEIKIDASGFYRPTVINSKCVNCGFCTKVCYKYDDKPAFSFSVSIQKKKLFSAWAKDEVVLKNTTSGGVGDLLAHALQGEGYSVAGVVYDTTDDKAKHRIADSNEDLLFFRGSKYIQSYTLDVFKKIVQECKNTKWAVFGTPCQIYALNRFVEHKNVRDNFLFVDIFCHGCPSFLLWRKYIDFLKHKKGVSDYDSIFFRSKAKGWGNYCIVAKESNKIVYRSSLRNDPFYELFFSDSILNDACYNCLFRESLEYTDIRLGDFWGEKYIGNHKGVSAVCISSDKGNSIFNKVKENIVFEEGNLSELLKYQRWGKRYSQNIDIRNELLDTLCDENASILDAVTALRGRQKLVGRLKRYVKSFIYLFPPFVANLVKRSIYLFH